VRAARAPLNSSASPQLSTPPLHDADAIGLRTETRQRWTDPVTHRVGEPSATSHAARSVPARSAARPRRKSADPARPARPPARAAVLGTDSAGAPGFAEVCLGAPRVGRADPTTIGRQSSDAAPTRAEEGRAVPVQRVCGPRACRAGRTRRSRMGHETAPSGVVRDGRWSALPGWGPACSRRDPEAPRGGWVMTTTRISSYAPARQARGPPTRCTGTAAFLGLGVGAASLELAPMVVGSHDNRGAPRHTSAIPAHRAESFPSTPTSWRPSGSGWVCGLPTGSPRRTCGHRSRRRGWWQRASPTRWVTGSVQPLRGFCRRPIAVRVVERWVLSLRGSGMSGAELSRRAQKILQAWSPSICMQGSRGLAHGHPSP